MSKEQLKELRKLLERIYEYGKNSDIAQVVTVEFPALIDEIDRLSMALEQAVSFGGFRNEGGIVRNVSTGSEPADEIPELAEYLEARMKR